MSDIVQQLREEAYDRDWPVSGHTALEAALEIERLRGLLRELRGCEIDAWDAQNVWLPRIDAVLEQP
jgi:hypothetical protein